MYPLIHSSVPQSLHLHSLLSGPLFSLLPNMMLSGALSLSPSPLLLLLSSRAVQEPVPFRLCISLDASITYQTTYLCSRFLHQTPLSTPCSRLGFPPTMPFCMLSPLFLLSSSPRTPFQVMRPNSTQGLVAWTTLLHLSSQSKQDGRTQLHLSLCFMVHCQLAMRFCGSSRGTQASVQCLSHSRAITRLVAWIHT